MKAHVGVNNVQGLQEVQLYQPNPSKPLRSLWPSTCKSPSFLEGKSVNPKVFIPETDKMNLFLVGYEDFWGWYLLYVKISGSKS